MKAKPWMLWALAAAIVVQVTVPAVALFQEKPARFGFQMYSGYGLGSITVLDAAGRELELDMRAMFAKTLRPELDWTRYVPEHLCTAMPRAVTIVVEQDVTGRTSIPCD